MKRGLIDINLILQNDLKKQCLLLSVMTGLLFEDKNEDISLFYQYLTENYKFTSQFKTNLYKKYKIDETKCSKSLANLLDYLSSKIRRRICVFSFKNGLHSNYQSTYATKTGGYFKSIKIYSFQ